MAEGRAGGSLDASNDASSHQSIAEPQAAPLIPRRFHRYWEGELRPAYVDAFEARLRVLHPGWDIRTWTPDDLPTPVRLELRLASTRRPDRDRARYRSNVLRYWLLHELGGIWLDCDVMPLRSFEPLRDQGPFFATLAGSIEGAVIGAAPGHPLFGELVRRALAAEAGRSSVEVSGAGLLAEVVPAFEGVVRLTPRAVFQSTAGGGRLDGDEPDGGPFADHLWASSRTLVARRHDQVLDPAEARPGDGPRLSLRPVAPGDAAWLAALGGPLDADGWAHPAQAGVVAATVVQLDGLPVGGAAVLADERRNVGLLVLTDDPHTARVADRLLQIMSDHVLARHDLEAVERPDPR